MDVDSVIEKLGTPNRRGSLSAEKTKLIEELWSRGYSIKQIAEGVNEAAYRISNYLVRTGAKTVNKRKRE